MCLTCIVSRKKATPKSKPKTRPRKRKTSPSDEDMGDDAELVTCQQYVGHSIISLTVCHTPMTVTQFRPMCHMPFSLVKQFSCDTPLGLTHMVSVTTLNPEPDIYLITVITFNFKF